MKFKYKYGLSLLLVAALLGAACTATMVGGGGDYRADRDERDAGSVAADTAISSAIKGKIAADPVVSVFEIGVRTWNGTVTLTGAVGSIRARETAEDIARGTSGVRAVNNLIDIEDRSGDQ